MILPIAIGLSVVDHRGLTIQIEATLEHYQPRTPDNFNGQPDTWEEGDSEEIEFYVRDLDGRYTHREIMRFLSDEDIEYIESKLVETLDNANEY